MKSEEVKMLQNIMQERTRARIVPFEPTLKSYLFLCLFSLICLLIFVGTFFLSDQLRSLLAPMASLGGTGFTCLIIALVKLSDWTKLEKKRQQTAHFIFRQNQSAYGPVAHPYSLPVRLAIGMHRRWSATYIVGTISILLILAMNGVGYAVWQSFVQRVIQQGEAIGWILFGTLFYFGWLAILDICLIIYLIFQPRQQLTATQDGLLCRRGYHLDYIPWHEARLFAIIGQAGDALVYELASGTQIIRWTSKPVSGNGYTTPSKTVGLTNLGMAQPYLPMEEYQQSIQTLNAMVSTNTRLTLYDLRAD